MHSTVVVNGNYTTTLDWLQSNSDYDLMLGDLVLEDKMLQHRAIVSQASSLVHSGDYIASTCIVAWFI